MSGHPTDLAALAAAVQHNCHIADARHAGELTMCTYLLQMREFWRWEHRLGFGAAVDRRAVGAWLAEREALWERLEGEAWQPLPLGEGRVASDPFIVDPVNHALQDAACIYGAGLVGRTRPVFFVARIHRRYRQSGLQVVETGEELARTLLSPPAVLAGGGAGPVLLRRQAMARWCWERTEGYTLRPAGRSTNPGDPMRAMLVHYGLDRDFEAGLLPWLDDQCTAALQHELAEHELTASDAAGWTGLRQALPDGRPQVLLAALRDLLVDLGRTLPGLLADRAAAGALHTWFAGFDGLRLALCPGLRKAYGDWLAGDGGQALRSACAQAHAHFDAFARELLSLWHSRGRACGPQAAALLASPRAVMSA